MHRRIAQYKALGDTGSSLASAQSQRRQLSLKLQHARRQQTFEMFRSIDFEDMSLTDAENDSEADEIKAQATQNVFGMQIDLKDTEKKKNKFARFADKLTFASHTTQLPDDLQNWLAVAIPEGKRCLARSYYTRCQGRQSRKSDNCILLARQSGLPITRVLTALPPNCSLDCIFDATQDVLFVLDVIEWHNQGFSESETAMRFFWRDSKVSELHPQFSPNQHEGLSRRVLVLSVQSVEAANIADQSNAVSEPIIVDVLESDHDQLVKTSRSVALTMSGVVLYMKEALYAVGETDLCLWIPKAMPTDSSSHLTLDRMYSSITDMVTN